MLILIVIFILFSRYIQLLSNVLEWQKRHQQELSLGLQQSHQNNNNPLLHSHNNNNLHCHNHNTTTSSNNILRVKCEPSSILTTSCKHIVQRCSNIRQPNSTTTRLMMFESRGKVIKLEEEEDLQKRFPSNTPTNSNSSRSNNKKINKWEGKEDRNTK